MSTAMYDVISDEELDAVVGGDLVYVGSSNPAVRVVLADILAAKRLING